MHRDSVPALGPQEVGVEVGFYLTPGGSPADGQEIEHEFGNGIGGCGIGYVDMGRIERGHDLIALAVFDAEGIGKRVQFKSVAVKMLEHGHTARLAVLQHDDGDAGG